MSWEQASEGRRQPTWSTGRRDLRRLAGLGAEAPEDIPTDDELEADTRLGLPTDAWDRIERAHLGLGLLNFAETGGLDAVRDWPASRDVEWIDQLAASTTTGLRPAVVSGPAKNAPDPTPQP